MTRVPFGTTASPSLLAATLRHHLGNVAPLHNEVATLIRGSFYVDGLLTGAQSIEEARHIADTAASLLSAARE